jgi:hypothetical protein
MPFSEKFLKHSSRLRRVLADQDPQLLEELQKVGFATIEEALPYAKQFRERSSEYARMSGGLVNNKELYESLKAQLPKGEIVVSFVNKKDLGRMRALVRLVCFRNGYHPQFKKVNGEEQFERLIQDPIDYDSYGSRYSVKVSPMVKPKALAFFQLAPELRRKLSALAH